MCGRFSASRSADDLVHAFMVDEVDGLDERDESGELAPSWNVAPTDDVYAVLERPPRGEPDAPPRRLLRVVRWGLVPSWAKDPKIGSRMINARVETLAEKPAFKRAFASRRCILPADGYYEWYDPAPTDGAASGSRGKSAPRKQPFFIRPRDGGVLALAGLYELWRDDERERDDPRAWLWTATVITTEATDDLGRIHDRMPMFVEAPDVDTWLDPRTDLRDVSGLLVPALPGMLEAYPVSVAVGNVKNNDRTLVDPIPIEDSLVVVPPPAADDHTLF
jgi:putative SOS response-associated peptidase YedK